MTSGKGAAYLNSSKQSEKSHKEAYKIKAVVSINGSRNERTNSKCDRGSGPGKLIHESKMRRQKALSYWAELISDASVAKSIEHSEEKAPD